jgi:branched-chain amino acid transport system substrate-binding protein
MAVGLATGLAMGLAAGAAQAADPVKVGFVGGISGACGPLVASELNAVKMGVAELNAKGGIVGRKVELVIRDSKSKPDEGAKMARDLVINEDVDVLTGVCSSSVMLAISAVSKELKTPFYSTIGSTQKGNIESFQPYFWQTQANAMMEAIAAAEYVAKNKQWKRITPMGFDYEWGHTSVKSFVSKLKELRPDVEIADPIYPKIGEKNMTPYITAALSSNPDAVFAAVFGGGLVNLIKQGKSFGMFERSNLVTLMTVDTMQALGKDMPKKGVYGISRAPFYAMMDNPKAKAFVDAYKKAHGDYPPDWAVSGYDGLMYYAAAAEAAGSVDADKLLKAVTSISHDGLRAAGMKVRAFDGQMNAPSYVGAVTHDSPYGFPIMNGLVKVDGEKVMLPESVIADMRAKAANK